MARRWYSYYDSYWPRYEPSRPIPVKDGIKAKSQRGEFVKHWWGDRWINALTRLMDPGRLSRGRRYARGGQVIEIVIKPGHVSARVQGSRRTPYKVSIALRPLSDQQWDMVFDALAGQAIFAAQLLNGEMPQDIEEVFDAVNVPLFPSSQGDLKTDCSCPDWANPCKHIAAVYYLLGERFDEDPFLLFQLRGRDKDAVIAALRERRIQGAEPVGETPHTLETVEAVEAAALTQTLERYWKIGPEAEGLTFKIGEPQVEMALLKRLGAPEFEGLDAQTFWVQMKGVYHAVTHRALEVAFADAG